MPALDLSATSVDLTRTICDLPSVSGDETRARRCDRRRRARRCPHLEVYRDGDTIVARTDLGRAQRVAIAGHIDTVPINGNVPTRDIEIDGEPLPVGPGHGRHEGRRGGAAEARRRARRPPGRHHLDVVRPRGGGRRPQRAHPARAHPSRLLRRRLRDPRRALERSGRGRLQRHAARDRPHPRRRGRTAPARGWARTPSTRRRRCSPASPTTSPASIDVDGLVVSRGAERRAHRRRGREQRDPRPVRDRGELPLRAEPRRRRGRAARARGLRRLRRRGRRSRAWARAPDSTPRSRASSWRRSAPSRGRSTAGRMSRGSARSACRPSTTARATRSWRTTTRNASRSRRSTRSSRACGRGWRVADHRRRRARRLGQDSRRAAGRRSSTSPRGSSRPSSCVVAAELSGFASRFGPEAGLGDLILGWDARWYWIVAETGYPTELPLTDCGAVAENQWAFMPVYAYLAKLVVAAVRRSVGGRRASSSRSSPGTRHPSSSTG